MKLMNKTVIRAGFSERFSRMSRKTILFLICSLVLHGLMAVRLAFLGLSALPIIKIMLSLICCAAAAAVDYREKRIPNQLVLTLSGLRLLLIPVDFLVFGGTEGLHLILMSLIGGAVPLMVLFLFSVLSKGGFGMGDVKLCTAIGFMSGLASVAYPVLFGIILCAVFSVVMMIAKKKTLKDQLPFGPFIYLGMLISIGLGRV